MALHLLDADAVIDYLWEVAPSVSLIEELAIEEHQLCISDVVVAEVYTGLRPLHMDRAVGLMARCRFLSTGMDAARKAGQWRSEYARLGMTLGVGDCLIAATAWQHNATLVTGNVRHFPMDEITVVPLPRAR